MKNKLKEFFSNDLKNILIICFFTFAIFILLHDVCESSIVERSAWNSYEIQANSWLNGRMDIDYVDYLEIAEFEGKYYISFPPFPSVVMLPIVAIFGVDNTHSNFIMFIVALLTIILAYTMLRKRHTSELNSMLLSFGLVIGSNMMALVLNSGVWFMAQLFNMFLCLLAFNYMLEGKQCRTYICLAFAVGCRPFSALYLIAAFLYFIIKDRKKGLIKLVLNNILPIIPVIIIAIIYMGYNYARFKNPLEFGHNYLQEFDISNGGEHQFSNQYLENNTKELFRLGIEFDNRLNINFDIPFMFLIANPMLLVGLLDGIKKLVKYKRINIIRLIFKLSILLNIILLCMHRTLGGWQFGSRYTLDFLSVSFICLLFGSTITTSEDSKLKKFISIDVTIVPVKLNKLQIFCILFGFILNIVGAIEFWKDMI